MAEKRYKSFVVIGDDDAKTTREFFYIGSGENRSAEAMRQDALDYYEENFQNTWFPEISNQRNYNTNPQEFTDKVVELQRTGQVEYTKIPKLGERWIFTPATEETPTNDEQETATIVPPASVQNNEWYTPSQNAELTGQTLGAETEDDRVGLPEDEDDYEDEARIFSPSLMDITQFSGTPGDEYISGDDPGDENDVRDTDELPVTHPAVDHPADQDTPDLVQLIGGFHIDNENKDADKKQQDRPAETTKKDSGQLPTPEEMDAELRRLRENPRTDKHTNDELKAIPVGTPTEARDFHHSCPLV